MIKVGFITSHLSSGHQARGIGFYTRLLLEHLKPLAQKSGFEILEVENSFQVSNSKFQIIHYPYFDLFSHTLPLFKTAETVVTIHDVIPLEFPDHYPPGLHGWVNFQLQKLALRSVSRVVTDSFYSLTQINKFLGVPPHQLRLVYLSAGPEFKKIPPSRYKLNLPPKYVLYVGDINYNKNLPCLVQACRNIKMPLVVVGKNAASLKSQDLHHPELRHLRDVDWSNVIRLDFVQDLPEVYSRASVYCQPSLSEGFGLPVLEAMACGTPVVASSAGSLPEIAAAAALYFDPHSVSDLSAKLSQMISTPRLARQYATNGLKQAGRFFWGQTALATLWVYQELI